MMSDPRLRILGSFGPSRLSERSNQAEHERRRPGGASPGIEFSTRCRVVAKARLPPAESPTMVMFLGVNPISWTRYRYAATQSSSAAGKGFFGVSGAAAESP